VHQEIDSALDDLAKSVVDAAFTVHKTLGPGLLESAYEICLGIELKKRGIPFLTQVPVSISYSGETVESALRLDMIVDGRLILELKSIENLLPIHEAQLLTYLRLTNKRLGLLVNFNVPLIKHGIKRIVL
jgi:GxxExxY protein